MLYTYGTFPMPYIKNCLKKMAYNFVTKRLVSRPITDIIRIRKVNFSDGVEPKVPKNVLAGLISADNQKENGAIYDKKPMKILLEAGKRYSWCLCGKSKNQPFCDGTHKNQQLKITQKPIRFQVEETKEYWLCNCKQTKNRPFCDGTHKLPIVKEGTSIVRQ